MKNEKKTLENNYYVYYHKRLKDNSIFYVGKGKNDRAYSKTGRNIHWQRIVKKDGGFSIEIIKENLTNLIACELEKQEIERIGLKTLSNQTLGGEGGDTRISMSMEQYESWKHNKSIVAKGKPHPWSKGKKRPEHSKFMTGRKNPKLKDFASQPKTEEHKRKISLARIGMKLKKIECEKCHRLISNNNMHSHLKGNECISKKHIDRLIQCEFCKRLISFKQFNKHKNSKKCKKGRVETFI